MVEISRKSHQRAYDATVQLADCIWAHKFFIWKAHAYLIMTLPAA